MPKLDMSAFPAELEQKILSHMQSDDVGSVLACRLVNKTWNNNIPFGAVIDTFCIDRRSIPFLFERFFFLPLATKGLRAFFKDTPENYSILYTIVYKVSTTKTSLKTDDKNLLTRQIALYDFAFEVNERLQNMFPKKDAFIIKQLVFHMFKYVDRFHARRMSMPSLESALSLLS